MKPVPECIPCTFKQAYNAVKRVTDDETLQMEVLTRLAEWFSRADINTNPSMLSQPAYELVSEVTGVADPYLETKRESNEIAESITGIMQEIIDTAQDPLNAALHVAAAGNTIDLGTRHDYDIKSDVIDRVNAGFAINDIEDFRKDLDTASTLLYLGDNCGEIVFDRLMIKELLKTNIDITYCVKSGPILNDATMEDARSTGITDLVRVIETGSADIGVNWSNASSDFIARFESADIIIGKGHGNYETCEERPENIYFLIQAKCPVVARSLGIDLYDIAFRKSANR